MTITVTPDPSFEPPRNTVIVTAPSSGIMQAVRVWRNDPEGQVDLAEQPAAGFSARTVHDYECAYEVECTYGWTVTYIDPTALTTLWDEVWASIAAWTVASGSFNVSSGRARNNASGSGLMTRSVTPGKYRVTVASMVETASIGVLFHTLRIDPASYVDLELTSSGSLLLAYVSNSTLISTTTTTIDATHPITVDMGVSSWTISGTGGSYTVPVALGITGIEIGYTIANASNVFSLGEVKVQNYPAPSTISGTSDPVTLDSHDTWLIHRASPGKSFKLQNVEPAEAGIRTFGDLSNVANSNLVKVMGSDQTVPITNGDRGDDELSITIATVSSNERAALRAVLKDELPLLIQVPPSWESDFACGFYAFGTSVERRQSAWLSLPQPSRLFDIPIVRVGAPIVDVENVGWSVAQVLAEFASIGGAQPAVKTVFATVSDLANNIRR